MKIKHLVVLLVGMSLIICTPLFIEGNNLITIMTISQTLFAFITLFLAITLFDRYQAGTKLNNQTIDLVIKYIQFLKSLTLLIQEYTYDGKATKKGFEIVYFDKSNIKSIKKSNNTIYIDFGTYIGFHNELTKFINSPWMPKEIFESSQIFVSEMSLKVYKLKDIKEDFLILNFIGYESTLEDELVILNRIGNCGELSKNIEKLLAVIENWVKTQAADINIRM